MRRIPAGVHVAIVMRSLLVQAAWNYRTMIGCGMAFALLPLRRYLGRTPEGVDRVDLEVHAAHFNAHPYLTSAALGSLARMEVEDTPRETVVRFRDAVKGPLGALGDRLVWAAWLPFCSVLSLGVFWAGAPEWAAVLVFLGMYNAGHAFLRVKGYLLGWAEGPRLGMRLRQSGIPGLARRVERLLMVALGLMVGVLAASGVPEGAGTDLHLPGALALGAGALLGPRAWKPAAVVVVGAVALVLVIGLLR